MSKKKLIEVIVVNIAATPHPDGVYFKLFETAAGKRVEYASNGEKLARFSQPKVIQEHKSFFEGHLLTWTEVSKNKDWVDLNSEKLLDDTEKNSKLKMIDSISKDYGLSAYRFNYVFNTQDHKLYIERKNSQQKVIMPNQIKSILKKLMSFEMQDKNAPAVEITIIPENGVVDNILELSGLNKLSIGIVKPNPDATSDDVREKVLARLNDQNAHKAEYILFKDQKEDRLTPDQETKNLAIVAAEDGFVRGEGVDNNGVKTKLSTEDKPKIIQFENNPNETLLSKLHNMFNFW
ncbi:hypothetical protein CIN_21710 [Commensalibacter intestini A911]|uniref:DUF4747 domain-containing protein n=1 Tax=Commensalibacter intestini A911 TaxID=1088868 RepID=G6F3H5_9PROT|nr:DUF4747 family protein [Commensalibacter intestini]EHD12925.1 hypothetical protein CIN_21710 [Commensalibacter intestini A911]